MGKGLATVYSVRRITDSKHLAVKAFQKASYFESFDGQGKVKHRLIQEVLRQELRFLSECRHPNVCGFEGAYETENSFYIAMEKYDCTLEAVLRRPGAVPRRAVLSLLQQMLRGAAYLHARGIAHRDLKIENVMVRRAAGGEEAVLIDLGLAEEFARETYFSERCGTPGYIAPEVFGEVRSAAPEKCDVFALGVIFHIL